MWEFPKAFRPYRLVGIELELKFLELELELELNFLELELELKFAYN